MKSDDLIEPRAPKVDRLFEEILAARERVYCVGDPTPLQQLDLAQLDIQVWVKREDLGPIKAYKWRGAYNAMAALTPEQRALGIVTASAGNHGQGVALAAKALHCQATIFMPLSTPELKQNEVRRFGGEQVEIRLIGDTYDDAGYAAREFCEDTSGVYIHPYDDLAVMGGQGTLADEIVMSGKGPFDRVYVAIGGGGLISAMACWLKKYWPEIKVIGVEGEHQASMQAALEHGSPVGLDYVDVFCDGTAVRKAGENTFGYCRDLLDGIVTVTNDEVCHSMRLLWETLRVIPEPSGAMGLAGFYKDQLAGVVQEGEKVLTVISGANMDFAQLSGISDRAGIGSNHRRFLRIPIPEEKGALVQFLEKIPQNISIIDLQYGKIDSKLQYPVIGLIGVEADYQQLDELLKKKKASSRDVSKDEDVGYRIINYAQELFQYPLFMNVEFPERAGAFRQFMNAIKGMANLCYVNYSYSGERVGRALVGMEFNSEEDHQQCLSQILEMSGKSISAVREVSDDTFYRLTGRKR